MNKKRIKAAIKLMKSAKNMSMVWYQGDEAGRAVITKHSSVEELHECGNTACFAGYLALSKEFKEAGGTVEEFDGGPAFNGRWGSGAVAEYLDIDNVLASKLVYGVLSNAGTYGKEVLSHFYGKKWGDVTPADVIAKLEMILRGELK